jgi:hypothetical protein
VRRGGACKEDGREKEYGFHRAVYSVGIQTVQLPRARLRWPAHFQRDLEEERRGVGGVRRGWPNGTAAPSNRPPRPGQRKSVGRRYDSLTRLGALQSDGCLCGDSPGPQTNTMRAPVLDCVVRT